MTEKVKTLYNKQSSAVKYFLLSCFVTLIDFIIYFSLYNFLSVNIVVSNTIAVVAGFAVHYIIGSVSVFKTDYGAKGFIIYLLTFLLGLFLADVIIYYSDNFFKPFAGKALASMIGKALSIVFPYFVMYYIRKFAFETLKKED